MVSTLARMSAPSMPRVFDPAYEYDFSDGDDGKDIYHEQESDEGESKLCRLHGSPEVWTSRPGHNNTTTSSKSDLPPSRPFKKKLKFTFLFMIFAKYTNIGDGPKTL